MQLNEVTADKCVFAHKHARFFSTTQVYRIISYQVINNEVALFPFSLASKTVTSNAFLDVLDLNEGVSYCVILYSRQPARIYLPRFPFLYILYSLQRSDHPYTSSNPIVYRFNIIAIASSKRTGSYKGRRSYTRRCWLPKAAVRGAYMRARTLQRIEAGVFFVIKDHDQHSSGTTGPDRLATRVALGKWRQSL